MVRVHPCLFCLKNPREIDEKQEHGKLPGCSVFSRRMTNGEGFPIDEIGLSSSPHFLSASPHIQNGKCEMIGPWNIYAFSKCYCEKFGVASCMSSVNSQDRHVGYERSSKMTH